MPMFYCTLIVNKRCRLHIDKQFVAKSGISTVGKWWMSVDQNVDSGSWDCEQCQVGEKLYGK